MRAKPTNPLNECLVGVGIVLASVTLAFYSVSTRCGETPDPWPGWSLFAVLFVLLAAAYAGAAAIGQTAASALFGGQRLQEEGTERPPPSERTLANRRAVRAALGRSTSPQLSHRGWLSLAASEGGLSHTAEGGHLSSPRSDSDRAS